MAAAAPKREQIATVKIGTIRFVLDEDGWSMAVGEQPPQPTFLAEAMAVANDDDACADLLASHRKALIDLSRSRARVLEELHDKLVDELADLAVRWDVKAVAIEASKLFRPDQPYSEQWIRNASSRGYMPEPVARVGGSKQWTPRQIREWQRPGHGWAAGRSWTPARRKALDRARDPKNRAK